MTNKNLSSITLKEDVYFTDEYAPIYGTNSLAINLYDEGSFEAILYIEDAYQSVRPSDYSLISWAGQFVKKILHIKKKSSYKEDKNNFDKMLQNLIIYNYPYHQYYDNILKQYGWERYQSYLCVCVFPTHKNNATNQQLLIESISPIKSLSENQYILLQNDRMYILKNLSKDSMQYYDYLHDIKIFFKNKSLSLGISLQFQDFSEIWLHCQQAFELSQLYQTQENNYFFPFDNNNLVLLMLKNCFSHYSSKFYYTQNFKKLIEYDENHQSDLLKTLKCYFNCNYNTTRMQEKLHIARTTCIYRLNKIKQISGLNLEDEQTLLYLQIILHTLDV